ncbi:MAG TPA: hypothetical protein VFS43_39450 [Polyangiaceae bacterium]|nr:hypothetical protein [Polyangiaceae bacterium]
MAALAGGSACDSVLGIEELRSPAGESGGEGGSEAEPSGVEGGGVVGGAGRAGGGGSGPAGGQGGGGVPGAGGAGGKGGGGPACQEKKDEFEPNDKAAAAKRFDDFDTCSPARSVSLTMGGTADWFAFSAERTPWGGIFCEAIEAKATVQSTVPARVCYYLKPGSKVSCPAGTEFGDDPVPPGYEGCCGSNATRVTFGGADAEVLLVVAPASAGACFPYTLSYQY